MQAPFPSKTFSMLAFQYVNVGYGIKPTCIKIHGYSAILDDYNVGNQYMK